MGFVKYDQDGFVGVITINRPEALNALNTEVIQDLDAVLDSIDLGTTRVLVVYRRHVNSVKQETMFSVSWRHFQSRRSLLSTALHLAVEMSLQ